MRFFAAALVLPLLLSSYGAARADECSEMWFRRNRIYKDAGYCFKTARAIEAFGNAGCQYDEIRDVPLSQRDRIAVGRFAREESALGCRP